jgi:hypothetical protein
VFAVAVIVISVSILTVAIGFLPEKPYWASQVGTRVFSLLTWGIIGACNAEIFVFLRRRVFGEPEYMLGQSAHIACIFLGAIPELLFLGILVGLWILLP